MASPANFTGILLAAGRGRRFDPHGQQDKLLQCFSDGTAVAVRSAQHLNAVLSQICIVVRQDNAALIREFQRHAYSPLICSHADAGLAASLTCALAATRDSAGWLIALADMPFVQTETIHTLLANLHAGADIVAPVFQGQRGNPVGFSQKHLPDLMKLSGDQGARRLLANLPLTEVVVNDPGVLQDIDSKDDLRLLGNTASSAN